MSANMRIENIFIQVKAKLKEDGIKLWQLPYYMDGVPVESQLEELAEQFSSTLSIGREHCLAAINEFQQSAVIKLRARAEFSETGLVTLKVRTPCKIGGTRLLTIQIKLSELGSRLQELIGEQLNINCCRIKLIVAGKLLNLQFTLESQGIRNNQQILAVVLNNDDNNGGASSSSSSSATSSNEIYDRVRKAREDALYVIERDDEGGHMQMEDQDGNTIHLPPDERRSLMLALAMHEKGKSAIKRGEFSEALVLLLDSDEEYNRCRSQLLDSVDNFALLNLDIVWCYLCLRSITQLPDAENRLFICEQKLNKSYGPNMSRVVALKGNSAQEKALFMRLHLLQAVLYFHQNRRVESETMLQLAESELNQLKIDETLVKSLSEMGYSQSEARVGLRACNGDVSEAITYILEKRQSRRDARKLGKKENNLNISKSKDETWINPKSLKSLIDMGFEQRLSEVALRKSKNDIDSAINMLQHNADQLRITLLDEFIPNDNMIMSMQSMGFHEDIIKMALRFTTNHMDKSVEMLLKMQADGTYDQMVSQLLEHLDTSINGGEPTAGCSTSNSAETAQEKLLKKLQKQAESQVKFAKVFERFSEDLNAEDDDHLDLTLIEEENILKEYKKYLN